MTQRHKKCYNKTNNLVQTLEAENSIKIRHIEKLSHKNFGFSANPKLTIQKKFNKNIKTTPPPLWSLPHNLAFHNLCKHHTLPPRHKRTPRLKPKILPIL
jgi:hypothetical protein